MASTSHHGLPDGVVLRDLGVDDVAAGVALSSEAGWNQTADDWRYMIRHGRGWACDGPDGRTVASALTLPYGGKFAWISMVLVTETWRRRGIASALMNQAVDRVCGLGLIAGLDATPAGRTVYGPMGFREIYGLTRWRAESVELPGGAGGTGGSVPRAMTNEDLGRITPLDLAVFGADRSALLAALAARTPSCAWVLEDGSGFCLGRDGRTAVQIGPLVAPDEAAAKALLGQAFSRTAGAVYLDVPDHHDGLGSWLADLGFTAERPYTRMLLNHSAPLDEPSQVFAIAGPELG